MTNMTDELELLRNVQKALTPITIDDSIINAYKLGAFALIHNSIIHLLDKERKLSGEINENN